MTSHLCILGKCPQPVNGFVALGPVLQIRQSLTMIAMFRVVECLLEFRTGEIWAETTMKKPFPMAAFCDAAFSVEHVAFAGLTSWAVRLLLPFAYPTVCAAHADLPFVHSSHPFNCHNNAYATLLTP